MKKILIKNLTWLVLLILVVLGVGYVKIYYPDSPRQLKKVFRHVIATPIEHFYNSDGKTCGIWYERDMENDFRQGRSNERVKKCFQKAFTECKNKNILLIKESNSNENNLKYSFMQILKKNDQAECIMQHFYEEHFISSSEQDQREPLFFVNACTVLAGDLFTSCEPLYFKERKLKNIITTGLSEE